MLPRNNFEEFIEEVSTTYYNFRIWMHLNNEWVKKQDNFKTAHIPKLMRFILHGLQQVWVLGISRLLDEPHLEDKSRLSVKFILKEAEKDSLIDYYNAKMKELDMRKFEASNRQLRNEKISHKTPGSKVHTQKAGMEKFFEIIEHVVNELKTEASLETSKILGYEMSDTEAKRQIAMFMEKF